MLCSCGSQHLHSTPASSMVKGQQESPFHRLRKALKNKTWHTKHAAWCMAGLKYYLFTLKIILPTSKPRKYFRNLLVRIQKRKVKQTMAKALCQGGLGWVPVPWQSHADIILMALFSILSHICTKWQSWDTSVEGFFVICSHKNKREDMERLRYQCFFKDSITQKGTSS